MARSPGGPGNEMSWEEIWEKLTGKAKQVSSEKPGKKLPWLWILVGAAVVIWLLTGIYTVGPGEEGVVKRFGEHVDTTGPGLHYRMPSPIETVDRVNMEKIRIAEIGFRTVSSGQFQATKAESQMLTGDENIVDAQVAVQYKILNASDFLFNVMDVEQVLHDATEVALRGVVGSNTIDFVMIDGRSVVQSETMEFLQRLLDDYGSGLQVTAVKLQYVGPPEQVKDAFDEVVRAREDKEKLVRESEGYAADRVPKARGEAEQMVLVATAYKEQRVLQSEGDAAKFLKIVREHEVPAAFQVLAENGVSSAAQALQLVGTIEQDTALTREYLYSILSSKGATGGAQNAENLTGQNLIDAFSNLNLADEYQLAYDGAIRLTQERLYLETMEDVLLGTDKFIVDPETGGNLIPFLPLKELTGSGQSQEVVQ